MAGVSLEGVRKEFGPVQAIKDVSVQIRDGEFVCLVGPSGCGKSTLLRMVAGLEEISGGLIRIGERVVNDLPPKQRDIAMVFQSYALYPHMTVAENMSFSLRLRREPKDQVAERTRRAAEILDLGELLDRYPRQLSGGQRQRVAMGRALVRSPQVFLFDEPLSNLDARLRVQMRSEIKQLHQRLRTTMIYVTHDQIEAMTMADTIVVMRDGMIEQTGAPLDIYDKPANLFVAGFIGSPSMNFIGGVVEPDQKSLRTPSGEIVALGRAPAGSGVRDIVCGVRPEHVAMTESGIPAEVILVEPTGLETQVTVRAAGCQIVALLRERTRISPGDRVHLRLDEHHLHFFDPSNGQRIAE